MDLIDARRVVLARGDGDDLRLRVAQQDLDEFQGGVARASQDGDVDHGLSSSSVVDVPRSLYSDDCAGPPPPSPEPAAVMHRTIRGAADALRAGQLTCVELLEMRLARIDQHDAAHPRLGRRRSRPVPARHAQKADAELKAGLDRGPLHGIPVAIKDIIDVFDLPTACGSKRWQNSIARQDAPCVARLRQAGAVIVGKTVTTLYASFDPPPTRNPWDLTRTPGGSSSGSAAAVAMGMCLAALGSQTGGSITRPASYCGVAAVQADLRRGQHHGVLPLAPSMDHVGAMAELRRGRGNHARRDRRSRAAAHRRRHAARPPGSAGRAASSSATPTTPFSR